MNIQENYLNMRDIEGLNAIEDDCTKGHLANALRIAPIIDLRSDITKQEFEQQYRFKKRPVILQGYANQWNSVKNWSFEYFANCHGNVKVVLNSYSSKLSREVTMSEFVDLLNTSCVSNSLPLYLQEWYYQTNCPDLAIDMPELDICQYDFRKELYGEKISKNHQLWMGQRGGITRLHQDSYMIDVMHVQIVGEKHWVVMNPKACLYKNSSGKLDFERLIHDENTELMQCILQPGDVLYLPAQWYHRINLLSDSIGLGRKCLDQANLSKHIYQRMNELLALALNADEIKRTHPELFNVVISRNKAWAKLMNINLSTLRP